ncbi:MAG: CoA ester lyase [Pseudomonadota bacterium]
MSLNPSTRIRRSALYVPCDRPRAMAKAETLGSDIIIFDLEDAVAPDIKAQAREALRGHFQDYTTSTAERIVRINGLETPWGTEDFLAARAVLPDGIVLPKVSAFADVEALRDALSETDAPSSISVWAMIETAAGVFNIADITEQDAQPLTGLIVGTNDLFKETGLGGPDPRAVAHPWLMQIVLAAKARGLAVLDGVFNDFKDVAAFESACHTATHMGFDGKTLIHPNQVDGANRIFAPHADVVREADAIVAAFAQPENADKGVISLDGKMVERLHLHQAEALLLKVAAIHARKKEQSQT